MQKWELPKKFPFLLSSCRHFGDSLRALEPVLASPFFFGRAAVFPGFSPAARPRDRKTVAILFFLG